MRINGCPKDNYCWEFPGCDSAQGDFGTAARKAGRDEGLVSSALARPRNLFAYAEPPPDLAALAAAYAYGIARDHPFVDGNKRSALVAARTFLILNGVNLDAGQDEKFLTLNVLPKDR